MTDETTPTRRDEAAQRFKALPARAHAKHKQVNDIRELIAFSAMLEDESIAERAHVALDDLLYELKNEER